MRAHLRRLLERTAQKVNRSAAGSSPPAGIDASEERGGPTARERTLMRRRLRVLRRQGADGDAELRAIEDALRDMKALDELLEAGLSIRCPRCGELAGRRERECWSCGAQLAAAHEQVTRVVPRNGRAAAEPPVTGASSARSRTPRAH